MDNMLLSDETPETLAFAHSLDLVFSFIDEAERQGMSNSQLAKKMGISKSRLSNILSSAQNMTLKTIAKFEIALNVKVDYSVLPSMAGTVTKFESKPAQMDYVCMEITPELNFSEEIDVRFSSHEELSSLSKLTKEVAA